MEGPPVRHVREPCMGWQGSVSNVQLVQTVRVPTLDMIFQQSQDTGEGKML